MAEIQLTRQTTGATSRTVAQISNYSRALVWRTPIYRLMLGGKHPQRLLASPADPWPGATVAGASILAGKLNCGGTETNLDNEDVWSQIDASPKYHRNYAHAFAWLRDLGAVADAGRARELAERMTKMWLDQYGSWHPVAWAPDVIGGRILFWTFHAPLVLASSDMVYRSSVLDSLARQARHLHRAALTAPEGVPRVRALAGLAAAGLLIPGCGPTDRVLHGLERTLSTFILADGGPVSRNICDSLAIIEMLLMLRSALHERGEGSPNWLMVAIDRLAPFVRAQRHASGALAQFHGAYADDGLWAESVLARSDAEGGAQDNAPHSGFQRIAARRSLLLFDVGPPPTSYLSSTGHAAPLAFEFSEGTECIVVNLGGTRDGWASAAAELGEISRSTAAHSTLIIADTNIVDIRPGRGLGDAPLSTCFDRLEAEEGLLVEAEHDGYARKFGILHRRRLFLAADGSDLRGEDGLSQSKNSPGNGTGLEYAIRFHLHPSVSASTTGTQDGVLLRLENGKGWRFKASGAEIELEESLFCDRPGRARKTNQIVLSGPVSETDTKVKWSFRRISEA